MVTCRILATAGLFTLLATASPGADSPAHLVLLPAPASVPGWTVLPPLTEQVYRPDLLLTAGCRTLDEAVERLRRAVADDHPAWVRLETLELTAVGDCETCQPPPVDPGRYLESVVPATLVERQFTFFARAAEALRGSGARPYLVVPPGTPPPDGPLPADLLVLLGSPPLARAATDEGLRARGAELATWRAKAPQTYALVVDGYGAFAGLPLDGTLLRRQADALPYPAVIARDAATFAAAGPAWLSRRLAAVAVDGARSPAGDRLRLDQPLAARILDVFAPLGAELAAAKEPGFALARTTVAALEALAAWDGARAAGQPPDTPGLLARLDRRHAERGAWEPDGPLSEAFRAFVAGAAPFPRLTLPAAQVTLDGTVGEDEWRGATRLDLSTDDLGRPTKRPSVVTLAATPEALWVGAVATEPRTEDATLRDQVVLTVAPAAGGPAVRVTANVAGEATIQHLTQPGATPSAPESTKAVTVAGTFDGPGWMVEAKVPWSLLGVGPELRLSVVTEHLSGTLRDGAAWPATGGGSWMPERWAVVGR